MASGQYFHPRLAEGGNEIVSIVRTDGENCVILNSRHAQVLNHALDLRVTNVGTVDVANQVQRCKHGDKANINLSEDLLSLLLGVVCVELSILWVQAKDAKASNVDGLGRILKVRVLVHDVNVALFD